MFEINVQRVNLCHSGKDGIAACRAYQVPGVDKPPVYASRERGDHPGISEIEFRKVALSFCREQVCLGCVSLSAPIFDVGLSGGLLRKEFCEPCVFYLRMLQQCFLGFNVPFRLFKLCEVSVLLDEKEQLTLLHDIAILEIRSVQIARHARDKLDRVDRLRIAADYEVVHYFLPLGPAYGHLRRRRLGSLRALAVCTPVRKAETINPEQIVRSEKRPAKNGWTRRTEVF